MGKGKRVELLQQIVVAFSSGATSDMLKIIPQSNSRGSEDDNGDSDDSDGERGGGSRGGSDSEDH